MQRKHPQIGERRSPLQVANFTQPALALKGYRLAKNELFDKKNLSGGSGKTRF